MKQKITIAVIVLVLLGFGYYLFQISKEQEALKNNSDFDYSKVSKQKQTEPKPVTEQDHVLGNPNAKNVFIAYEDMQCPACAAANPILQKVVTELKDTKLVFRHFPLVQIHKNATLAAYATEAAGVQGKFWEMKDALYSAQSSWEKLDNPLEQFANIAKMVGVADTEKFKQEIVSKKYKDRVEKDLVEALSLDLQGTPTFFFNGKQLENRGWDYIKTEAEKLYK